MFLPAAVARLNQYISDQQFQNVVDQIKASQDEGVSDFDVDVRLLGEDEIQDLILALDTCGYTVIFNDDAFMLEIKYE